MTPRYPEPLDSVLDAVGWTPLIRLNRVTGGARTPVYGKCEFFNPGSSVKDRIGLAIVEAAEREGRLRAGGVIVEATSGNTGVALAMAAAIKGYRCIFTMPDKMSQEKVRLLKAFGADVVITPTAVPPDHPDHYMQVAKRLAEETPGAVLADQFYNPVNPEAHYRSTGPEIWAQTRARITHLVAGAGTGGTVTGVARYLKERNPDIRVIVGDPVGSILCSYFRTGAKPEGHPYKVEGIGSDKIPGTLDLSLVDELVSVSDRDAFLMGRRLTREEGLFVGGSSGLVVHVAVELAHRLDEPDALIVCMLADTGERYLSKMYSDEWMRENRLLEPEAGTVEELMLAKDGSAPPLVSVEPATAVRAALSLITAHDVSQLPVLAEGDCVGSVSEATLMARVIEDPSVLDRPVEVLMEPPFPVIESHLDAATVMRLLSRQNPAVLVRKDGHIVGIITRYDVVRTITTRA